MNTKSLIITVVGTFAFAFQAAASINAPSVSLVIPKNLEMELLMLEFKPAAPAENSLIQLIIEDLQMTGALPGKVGKDLENSLKNKIEGIEVQNDALMHLKNADLEMTESPAPLPRF